MWITRLLSASCLALAAASAWAETRAVLIGVSDYVNLDADLAGPANDVRLMADMLARRGVTDVTLLAEGPGAIPPDRAAILSALDAAVAASEAGDTLVIYFSGHGSQAPDMDGDEQGGYDEIFLPRDAGHWNGALGAVENAILDDEFGAVARAALGRGVQVIAILDACHSATGFRALDDGDGRARYLDPETLEIPEATAVAGTPAPPLEGDFVFLYAAQSDQRAFEYPVDGEWYGDFTRTLVNVLDTSPGLSWRQAVAAASTRIRARSGQPAQTPDVEGTLADAAAFGDAQAQAGYPIDGTVLSAGALHDITPGSLLEVFADPTGAALGRIEVTEVRPTTSDVRYVGTPPALRVTEARLLRRAPDTDVRVTLTEGAARALERLIPDGPRMLAEASDVPVVPSAPHGVVWAGDSFALVGPDRVLDPMGPGSSPRLAWPAETPDLVSALAIALDGAAARIRLDKILAQVTPAGGAMGFALLGGGPQVGFTLQPAEARGRQCADPTTGPRDVGATAEASHCDRLGVTIANTGSRPQDVTLLYVDATGRIDMIWPTQGLSNRIPSGETRDLHFGLRNDARPGIYARETLYVLSLPAEPGDPRAVFSALADGQSRGNATPAEAWLGALVRGETTRGFSLSPRGGAALAVDRLDLVIAPFETKRN
ncbi:caspase family protein [Mesobacterium pallidum]|uniref:caspase family protein n=1 Tax=Mesobacterium pallidum TaxID=2872037 RepID=UPI001EE19232|nr:caspase family protein [Mesobacterium pallidum]